MPSNIERYVNFDIPYSILTVGNISTAVDYNNPLDFKAWLEYFTDVSVSIDVYEISYNNYINDWNKLKSSFLSNQNDFVRETYVSLAKDLTLDVFTEQERKFLKAVDFNDSDQVETVIPLISQKINSLTQYYKNFRERVKTQPKKANLFASNLGIRTFLLELISDALNFNSDTIDLVNRYNIDTTSVLNNISILIEDLYDEYTDYFDLTTNLPASSYEYGGENRTKEWNANTNPWDFNLFYDYDTSVIKLLSSFNYVLSGFSTNLSIPVGLNVEETFEYTANKDYIDTVKVDDINELNLQNKIALFKKFSGTDWYFLSTGDTVTNYLSSLMFTADKISNNYLNRVNVSTATLPNTAIKFSAKDLGGFYIPNYLGVLNYNTFNYSYRIDFTKLSANNVYTFPDPEKYIANRGNSDYKKIGDIFILDENNQELIYSISDGNSYGYIKDNFSYLNYHGYENVEEKNRIYSSGVSKNYDKVDFFKGLRSDVWSNNDIYSVYKKSKYPIDERQNDLITGQKDIVNFSTDIFGNQYGGLKSIRTPLFTELSAAQEEAGKKVCLLLSNYLFFDPDTGEEFDYSLSAGDVFDKYTLLTFERTGFDLFEATYVSDFDGSFFYGLYTMDWCNSQNFSYKRGNTYDGITYKGYNDLFYPDIPSSDSPEWSANLQTYYYTALLDGGCGVNGQRAYWRNDASFLTSLSTVVDGGLFQYANGNPFEIVIPNLNRINIPYSDYVIPSLTSTYIEEASITNSSIYSKRYTLSSTPYFRNISNQVTQLSAALSAIFTKYNGVGNIYEQLNDGLIKFDLVYDVGVFETNDYLVIEKINYDYDTNSVKPFTTSLNYIERTDKNSNIEQFGDFYFHERNNNLLLYKTTVLNVLSASTYKTFYPTFYKFGIDSLSLKKIFPLPSDNLFGDLSAYSLRSQATNPNNLDAYINRSVQEIDKVFNIDSINRPNLSYDPNTNNYGLVTKMNDDNESLAIGYSTYKFIDGIFTNDINEIYFQDGIIRDESYFNPLTANFLNYNKFSEAPKTATWIKKEGVLKLGE
tara:strand:+ start:656 stop:3772 length:3117 start_codon:yes stop_codon:yes gene_type:complete